VLLQASWRPVAGRRQRRERAPLPPGFGTIWTTVALDLVGFGVVFPLLPIYSERFGASPAVATLLITSFSAAQLVCAPLWGRLSDRVGRKPILLLSLVGTCVGSLVTGLAGALWVLFLGRVIDGISGASISVAQASVTDLAPPSQRARLLGLLGAAFGVGFVAGPALGALAALSGPHVPFLVAAALSGINAIVAWKRLPETHRDRSPRPAAERPSLLSGAGSVADLLVLTFVAMAAFAAFEATFSLFGKARLEFGEVSTGAVFAGVGILLALVQGGLVHPVVSRIGETGALRIGLLLNACGLLLLAGVESYALLVPSLALLTIGQGLASPSLSATLAGRTEASARGRLLGLQQSSSGLARVVGPAAGGLLFEHVGVSSPYLAGAAVMAVAALLLVRGGRQGIGGTPRNLVTVE
jgi:multidrug resistance protein